MVILHIVGLAAQDFVEERFLLEQRRTMYGALQCSQLASVEHGPPFGLEFAN